MTEQAVVSPRPDRWDHPLSGDMSEERVNWLISQPPFNQMDERRFARSTPLADILRNDARILRLQSGDLVFREGQYGGSAFLVLSGCVRIFFSKLLAEAPKLPRRRPWGWLGLLRSMRPSLDRRRAGRQTASAQNLSMEPVQFGYRGDGPDTRIFLQDVPGVLSKHKSAAISSGGLFGEMAAVTRSPREFTAMAEADCSVLEIRWQGLKLLKQDPAFRELLDERYRADILRTHLQETPLFRFIPAASLDQIVAATKFESFGNLEWYADYNQRSRNSRNGASPQRQSPSKIIDSEPLIAEEGSYAPGIWIIRGGFARLSRRQGAGHRTLAYLGKGQIFGLQELVHNHRHPQQAPLPFQESLRAIGYVDALHIPKKVVCEHVIPYVRNEDLPRPIAAPRYLFGQPVIDAPLDSNEHAVETGLLEFLVEKRLMNGHQSMVIDTDRCTRCDDCVRACAKTHGGTPVFIRQGPQYGPWMFAQACMHCEDPVCMIGCPTGAIHRDHESGLVQINEATCIGCKTCAESCPYDNIRMVPASDEAGRIKLDQTTGLPILQASKCDLCASSLGQPACQSACPHDALVRVEMGDLAQVSRLLKGRASA